MQQHDVRVIYLVHPGKGVPAPELNIRYRCPACAVDGLQDTVLDAYQGPPVCQEHRCVLEGISVIRPAQQNPHPRVGFLELGGVARDKGALDRSATDAMDLEFGETTP